VQPLPNFFDEQISLTLPFWIDPYVYGDPQKLQVRIPENGRDDVATRGFLSARFFLRFYWTIFHVSSSISFGIAPSATMVSSSDFRQIRSPWYAWLSVSFRQGFLKNQHFYDFCCQQVVGMPF